jgi:tetratricopeptide (TPR) repeat protein
MGLGGWPPSSGPFSNSLAQFSVHREFRALVDEALEAIGPEPSALRAQLISALAFTPPDQDSMEARERLSTEAVERARTSGDVEAMFVALFARLWALLGPDDIVKRLEVATQILDLAIRTGAKDKIFTGHETRVRAYLALGDMVRADQEIKAMCQLAPELRFANVWWSSMRFQVVRALGDGRFDEVEELAPVAIEHARKAHDPGADTIIERLWATWLLRERGGLEHARGEFEAAVQEYDWFGPLSRALVAYLYNVLEDRDAAGRHFEVMAAAGFGGLPLDEDWLLCLALLADVCADLDDTPRAEQLYELLEPYAALNVCHQTIRFYMGSVSHFLARLGAAAGRREEAVEHFEAALVMNERMGARPSLARTQYEFARLLLRQGPGAQDPSPVSQADRDRAGTLLTQAQTTAQELGMKPLLQRVRELR